MIRFQTGTLVDCVSGKVNYASRMKDASEIGGSYCQNIIIQKHT